MYYAEKVLKAPTVDLEPEYPSIKKEFLVPIPVVIFLFLLPFVMYSAYESVHGMQQEAREKAFKVREDLRQKDFQIRQDAAKIQLQMDLIRIEQDFRRKLVDAPNRERLEKESLDREARDTKELHRLLRK